MTITPQEVRDAYFVGAAIGALAVLVVWTVNEAVRIELVSRRVMLLTPSERSRLKAIGLLK